MAIEIERKFLVHPDWPRPSSGTRLVQGYLTSGGPISVRIRASGDQAWLTVKGPTRGLSRAEFEYQVPLEDAREMLALTHAAPIEKTRYLVDHGTHTIEVDVFEGRNSGLVVAEIELGSEIEAFDKPNWLGEEVSTDPRYRNTALSQRPYESWKTEP
jgi:adenylate cyclase